MSHNNGNNSIGPGEDKVKTAIDDLDLSPSDDIPGPSTLTNEQIDFAKAALTTIATHDGSLLDCREKLIHSGVHPTMSSGSSQYTTPPLPDSDICPPSTYKGPIEDNFAKLDMQEEFKLASEDLRGEDIDWSADNVEEDQQRDQSPLLGEVSAPIPPTIQSPQATKNHGEDSTLFEWRSFMIENFSILYSNLKQGIDAALTSSSETKGLIHAMMAEIKLARDEQIKLGAKLTEVTTRLDTIQVMATESQYDIREMKQEISICTTGFSKINSALLQMNTAGIPQGSIPSISNYKFEVNPTVASVKGDAKTTPISYSREKLQELLKQISMPIEKIPIMINMLENRTPRSFSLLLPQLNPNATLSDEAARELISMVEIKDGATLKTAFSHINTLLKKPSQLGENTVHTGSNTGYVSSIIPPKESPTGVRVPITKVKKCANPFAPLSRQ